MSSYYNRSLQILTDTDTHICFLTIFYILLINDMFSYDILLGTLALLITVGVYFSNCFFINDYFDMPYDIAAGKKRLVQNLTKAYSVGIIILMFVIGFGVTMFIIDNTYYQLLYAVSYFFGIFYSAPPLRLKDKWIFGIITDMFIERTFPMLLILVFYNYLEWDALLILLALSILQIGLILLHQIKDYDADMKTGIKTFVIAIGLDKTSRILNRFVQPLTTILMFLACVAIAYKIGDFGIPIYLMFLGYIPIVFAFNKKIIEHQEEDLTLPIKYLFVMLTIMLPLYFGMLLFIQFNLYIVILMLFLGSIYPYASAWKGRLFSYF